MKKWWITWDNRKREVCELPEIAIVKRDRNNDSIHRRENARAESAQSTWLRAREREERWEMKEEEQEGEKEENGEVRRQQSVDVTEG